MFSVTFLAFAASADVALSGGEDDAVSAAEALARKKECLDRACPVSTQFPSLDCPAYDAATCAAIDEVREGLLDHFLDQDFSIDVNETLDGEDPISPSTLRLLRCIAAHAEELRGCRSAAGSAGAGSTGKAEAPGAPAQRNLAAPHSAQPEPAVSDMPAKTLERCVAEKCPLALPPEGLACPAETSQCLEMISHIRVEMANMTISGRLSGSESVDGLDGLSCIRDRRSAVESCSEGMDADRSSSRLPTRLAPVADSLLEACLASSCPFADQVEQSGLDCSGVLRPGCAALRPVRLAMMRRFREKGFHVGVVRFFLPASKEAQVLPKCMEAHRDELRNCVEGPQKFTQCSQALCPVTELFPSLDCMQAPVQCTEVGRVVGELARAYVDAGYPEDINDYLPATLGFHGEEADALLHCFADHREQLRTCTEL